MPQQLIYTSAPRGIVAGRSGYCTVARSASMREALVLPLEKLCYYQHLSLSGGKERPIFACRIIDLRGTRFHVLTRIQDAGLDFTGRTNFVAHHLVFTPEEIKQFPTPPAILRDWPGWAKSWTKDAQLLETENWTDLIALAGKTNIPAQTWQRVTGDAINGYGLLEARNGASFRVDDHPTETVLGLFAESVELLEVRDTRRDFRTAGWQFTFTTSIQEQDNPADFRWRCIHSDNPAANRLAGPDCRALSSVRAGRCTAEETAFARSGRQPPRFVTEPQDTRLVEGEAAHFQVKAEGIPQPIYQWFTVDRHDSGQIIEGQNGPDLTVAAPPLGKSRYVVRASNSAGEATTNVVTLSVEQKLRVSQERIRSDLREPTRVGGSYVKSEDDIEKQRKRLQAEEAEKQFQRKLRRNKLFVTLLGVLLIGTAGGFGWKLWLSKKAERSVSTSNSTQIVDTNKSTGQSLADLGLAQISPNSTNPPGDSPQFLGKQTNSDASKTNTERPIQMLPLGEPSLPDGWERISIGTVAHRDATFNSNKFSLTAAAIGFSTSADSVFFVCKTNSANEFKASLITPNKGPALQTNSGRGVMVRESSDSNSPFLFIGKSSQKILVTYRDHIFQFHHDEFELPPNQVKLLLVRIKQENNQITPAYSTGLNNESWTSLEAIPVSSNANLLIGFALFSGSSSNPVAAQFFDLSVTNNTAKKK